MISKLKEKIERPVSLAVFGLWFATLGGSAGVLYGVSLAAVVPGMWKSVVTLPLVALTILASYVLPQLRVNVLPDDPKGRARKTVYAAAGAEAHTISKYLEAQAEANVKAGRDDLAANLLGHAAVIHKRVTEHEKKAYPR